MNARGIPATSVLTLTTIGSTGTAAANIGHAPHANSGLAIRCGLRATQELLRRGGTFRALIEIGRRDRTASSATAGADSLCATDFVPGIDDREGVQH